MNNPFIEMNCPEAGREWQRRNRFKKGVYTYQAAMFSLLMGLLIHGYFAPHPLAEVAATVVIIPQESTVKVPAPTVAQLVPSF